MTDELQGLGSSTGRGCGCGSSSAGESAVPPGAGDSYTGEFTTVDPGLVSPVRCLATVRKPRRRLSLLLLLDDEVRCESLRLAL
jgi:hypothetical protein